MNYRTLILTHTAAPWYEIDLAELTTSARILDAIVQLSHKTWCSADDIGTLVGKLDELLHPQGNCCSRGIERGPFDARAYINRAVRAEGWLAGGRDDYGRRAPTAAGRS